MRETEEGAPSFVVEANRTNTRKRKNTKKHQNQNIPIILKYFFILFFPYVSLT